MHIHDYGEGIRGKYVLYKDRKDEDAANEFAAFQERMSKNMTPSTFASFERDFLIQHCLKNETARALFPNRARKVMAELARERRVEALLFDAIERWDYVIYAVEQYQSYDNLQILAETLQHQCHHLDRLAKELDETVPVFGEQIWTPKIRTFCQQIIDENKDRFPI